MKKWNVVIKKRLSKEIQSLSKKIQDVLIFLMKDLESSGPIRGDSPNFSKLSPNTFHCHLKKGRPTYVACWQVEKENLIIEVYYVGTHEKAPY